jgi:hypothetical protein
MHGLFLLASYKHLKINLMLEASLSKKGQAFRADSSPPLTFLRHRGRIWLYQGKLQD